MALFNRASFVEKQAIERFRSGTTEATNFFFSTMTDVAPAGVWAGGFSSAQCSATYIL
jgi:hypothetical protein